MAAILTLRRGTSDISIADGELYLNKGLGSIQFGSGSNNAITLLPLNTPVQGDINLVGNISASGDVRIGGNIYLGNAAADNIQALGQFTSNLVPNGTIDVGTTSAKWNNVYGNTIWGAISASNGVISGSAQFTGVLASLNSYTSSQDTKNTTLAGVTSSFNGHTASLNTFTSSVNGHISDVNTWTASVKGHTTDINTKTGSFETKFSTLQSLTASVQTQLNDIQNYTSSLRAAITASGTNVTINGDLTVKGTNTFINSTTIQIGDNIIELNGTSVANGGLLVKDPTGGSTISGSLLWDSTNDYWKGGTLGSEEKLLRAGTDGVISSSLQITGVLTSLNSYTSSQDTKNTTLANITASYNTTTASLNTFSASVLGHIVDINTKTGSFETKNSTLQTYTASVDGKFTIIQSVTASFNTATASLNTFSQSINGHVTDINSWTSSVNNKFITLQSVTASLNATTASLIISASQLTASFTQLRSDFATLQTSVDPNSISGHLANINAWTSSMHLYTASINGHITDINTKTGSFETKNSTLQTYTASIDTKFTTLQSLTASNLNRFTRIEESTASLNLYTASIDTKFTTIQSLTSSNLNRLSRIEESTASLNLYTQSLATTYESRANATKVLVSGSSQVNFTQLSGISNGIISGSSQITPLLPTGIVSGSIQVLGSSTVLSGSNQTYITTINQSLGTTSTGVQFATLGIGTAPDATYELKVQGDIAASGDIVAYNTSDKRLKNNIQPIQNALDKVNQLGGYTFEWNEELQKARSGNDIGVIAQEVDSVFPQIVVRRDNGFLAVDYEKLVPVLIEAIKELSVKVKELENK